jgi:endonuclease-8
MPEGHAVHRLARDMAELRGTRMRVSSPQGRFTEGAGAVDGAVLEDVQAYGKHLLLRVDEVRHVHVHLGMQGKWFRYVDSDTPPLPQVRLRLANAVVAWDLIAPAQCELLDRTRVTALVTRLGPDPLRPDADEERATTALGSARGPIGAALLDQSLIAGVGNVFRSEALHAVGVAPGRPARSMSREELSALWAVLRQMMAQAVEDGRIVTVDGPDRLAVPESAARKVYKQQNCRDCGAPVRTSVVASRTAYHCPVEQPD